jgi:hypothetical protein
MTQNSKKGKISVKDEYFGTVPQDVYAQLIECIKRDAAKEIVDMIKKRFKV